MKGSSKLRGLTGEENQRARNLLEEIRAGAELELFSAADLALVKVALCDQIGRHQDGVVIATRLLGRLARHERSVADESRGRAAEA